MPKIMIAVLAVLAASPALSEECRWQSEAGDWLISTSPSEILVHRSGVDATCQLQGAGTGVDIRVARCESGDSAFFTVAARPGDERDILIFQNTAWYRWCQQ